METTLDELKGPSLWLNQPLRGPRVNVDTMLLAGFCRVKGNDNVIEVGTAHGAISLILAARRSPSIKAIDIQPDLIDLARRNAHKNGLSQSVDFEVLDVRKVRSSMRPQSFDVFVSNPPYWDSSTQRISDNISEAMARQTITCSIEDIVDSARYLLKDRARAYLVFTADRLVELLSSLTVANLEPKVVRLVYPEKGKNASVALIKAVRSASPGVIFLPPLFIDDVEEISKYYTLEGYPCP